MKTKQYQPKTGQPCGCKRGQERDNCPNCEGTGQRIDFKAIREAVKQEQAAAPIEGSYRTPDGKAQIEWSEHHPDRIRRRIAQDRALLREALG